MVDATFAYYYALQNIARRRTAERINRRVLRSGDIQRWDNLTLCSILGREAGDALKYAEEVWPKYYNDQTHHGFATKWRDLVYRSMNDPDHFNLAIWQKVEGEQCLVALALGSPSNARTLLTLKWIERFFGHNYLAGRALWPILSCAEDYARLLGCERVLIKDPVDPRKYQRYGYAVYRHPGVRFGGVYLGKEMANV
ncbi:MAG: hypothetical protein JJT99_13785 [Rhodobacteraceae bacterium]|nr:hypothetical protein [Paracoccaceae bacterium]